MVNNQLHGHIPSSIFNISTITVISLGENNFSGNLPENIGSFLPSLEELYLAENSLYGVVPNSISNASQLTVLDLPVNKFSGSIPNSLGDLKFLEKLDLEANNFTTNTTESSKSSEMSFVAALASARNLKIFVVNGNPLNGILPLSLGNFSSSLQEFRASSCNLKGYIASDVGNLSGLVTLELRDNDLIGEVPIALNKLSNLQRLHLGWNQLTGNIPNGLCKVNTIGLMELNYN